LQENFKKQKEHTQSLQRGSDELLEEGSFFSEQLGIKTSLSSSFELFDELLEADRIFFFFFENFGIKTSSSLDSLLTSS
jgi:hypothetical protein